MPKNPSFLRQEQTKKKNPPGLQSKAGVSMMSQVINQVVEAFKKLILPAAPQATKRASASPLGRGPFADTVRGPAPPPGAVRHDNTPDEQDNEDENNH